MTSKLESFSSFGKKPFGWPKIASPPKNAAEEKTNAAKTKAIFIRRQRCPVSSRNIGFPERFLVIQTKKARQLALAL
jgi:hypothetical protein